MIIFLLNRVKLNMTPVVTATVAGFLLNFLFDFRTLISKPFMYFSFVT